MTKIKEIVNKVLDLINDFFNKIKLTCIDFWYKLRNIFKKKNKGE